MFDGTVCEHCDAVVGVHRMAAWLAGCLIAAATVITSLMILINNGFFAAMFWLPFPVGSLSYVKARLSPLQLKERKRRA